MKAEYARSQKSTSEGRRSLQGRKTRAILKGRAAKTVSPLSKDTVRAGTHHSQGNLLADVAMDDRHSTVPFLGKKLGETREKRICLRCKLATSGQCEWREVGALQMAEPQILFLFRLLS